MTDTTTSIRDFSQKRTLGMISLCLFFGTISYISVLCSIFFIRYGTSIGYQDVEYVFESLITITVFLIGIGSLFFIKVLIIALQDDQPIADVKSLIWGTGMFVSWFPATVSFDIFTCLMSPTTHTPMNTMIFIFCIFLAILSPGPLTLGLWNPRAQE